MHRSSIRFALSLLVLLLLGPSGSRALAADKDITIVYDVELKQFRCWYEGQPVPKACGKGGSHIFEEGVHFYRGETIYLQFAGAHVADLFTVELTVNDITEPTVPIFGAISDLPKVKLIEAAETLIPAPGVVTVAGNVSISAILYASLDQMEKAEFQKYLEDTILTPTASDKFLNFINANANVIITNLDAQLKRSGHFVKEALSIQSSFESNGLNSLNQTYCITTSGTSTQADADQFLKHLRELVRTIARQRALREEIITAGLATDGKALVEQYKLFNDPFIARLGRIKVDDLKTFRDDFNIDFPVSDRTRLIRGIVLDKTQSPKYLLAPGNADREPGFLKNINTNAGLLNDEGLKRLKDNLLLLASRWGEFELAVDRLDKFQTIATKLESYQARTPDRVDTDDPLSVFQYQILLNRVGQVGIRAADTANCIAQNMPLPDPYDHIVLGRWFGSKDVAVTVKQGTRLPLFQIEGVAQTGRIPAAGGDNSQLGTTQTARIDPVAVRQAKFSIHNTYHFQLAAGFVVSTMRDERFQLAQRTITEGMTMRTEKFFVQTRDRSYHFLPTIELLIYPQAREYFPWKSRYPGERRPSVLKEMGLLVGFSLVNPTKDFFFGTAWMSRGGFGIKGGLHLGFKDTLPKGIEPGETLTDEITVVQQKLKRGAFFGVSMTTQVFKDIFGVIFKP
jgi:hypothetical protein